MTTTKSAHPLVLAAAVAVLLFCGVGTAALMGWLPSSHGDARPLDSSTSSTQMAALQASQPPASGMQPLAALPQQQQVTQAQPQQPPQPQPEPQMAAAPPAPPPVCSNCGVVESIHEINTRAEGSGVGAAGGAVVGGLLGHQVGGGHGQQIATVLGAIGGAVAGNQIEGNVRATHSYNIVVRLDNGKTRTIHQSAVPGWRQGDRVRVVNGGLRAA
ncbi:MULTISPECIES: glycine zipper 2TM domain-containing protein [unclassified Janthinobacterium]|uniref:glycine zipper 2TM domain-containing protein n=1 Tax=unclassified Janthinobacterium TaxID=2610881 RepID=UPI00160B12B1|nr:MULTISPECIES: glycine zipper 2TM domain-containing protein [unclassified Janthinobacterium]MBB5369254.1 outer membrane lipoprotein SlyB [Janthinobacterium sp. K2C7]MBB5381209.1 outer membrane lipoprotein SlyB [Janthinobacterium sp. K2Li3]MBB5387637.1 outer membrane lipoprotein SlyB [Janthinobacterium sp. K2E3]